MQDSLFSQSRPTPQQAIEPVQGVSRVVDYIKRIIEGNKTLAGIRVRGEVTELRERNGLLYFSLKENNDVLRCLVWSSAAIKLPPFKSGDEIICGGDFTAYTRQSAYELVVKTVELTGVGALYAQFEALKEKFRKEGLFEASRKRPLPAFPRRIAVVSAEGGKGVEDFFTTIAREAPFVEIIAIPTRVQGDGAEIDIAEAIDRASRKNVDVIVVTRGGGSYEDLFPFNREPVVRAIVRAKHPVISAVGHTQDVHLSDYVADHTRETPSNAAHFFGEIGKRFLTRVQHARISLEHSIQSMLVSRAQALDDASLRLARAVRDLAREKERQLHSLERQLGQHTPQRRLALRGERLAALRSRLEVFARKGLSSYVDRVSQARLDLRRVRGTALGPVQQRLHVTSASLNLLDPRAQLQRGYAIVTVNGKAVRDAATVPAGSLMTAEVQRGKLLARVEGSEP